MLSATQNQRLQELFERAAAIAPDEREAFLSAQCADDPQVLTELKSLLDIERAGLGSFLRDPLIDPPQFGADEFASEATPYDSDEFMVPRRDDDNGSSSGGVVSGLGEEALHELLRQKRYQLAGEISRGGMGVVLRGQDCEFDRPVAIKVMRRELRSSPYLVHRFVEEAQINGQLQHPGIVPVYDMGLRSDELPYFSMKLIEGKTLVELLAERPNPIELLGVFEQICNAVAYAHNRGIVHRDLKPANVMVGAFGEVHVLDWGVAKMLGQGVQENPSARRRAARQQEQLQSRCGTVIGTLPFMPPEQARGEVDAIGPAADVFALGAMICQLLTGRPAYVGSSSELYQQARSGDLGAAREALAACDADAELVALANDCLQVDPAARPRDASVVATRIRDYRTSIEERRRQAEIEAAEAKVMVAQERRARRLGLALTASIAVVLLGAGSGYAWWNGQRNQRAAKVTAKADAYIADAERALANQQFEQSLWQVDAARGALSSEDANLQLRTDSLPRIADIERQARLALDNARLLSEFENIRMPERGSPGAPDYHPTDWAAVDAAYHQLFAGAGMDPDEGTVEQAAQPIAARQASASWAPILDEWSVRRRWAGRAAGATRLLQLANLIDRDERRTRLRHALETGDTAALVDQVTPASRANDSASTLNLLGHALQQAGQRSLAIEVFRAGCSSHSTSFSMHMNLARALMSHGGDVGTDAAEAARHYQAASVLRPDNLEARHELARTLHMFLGENERAEEQLQVLLDRDPDDAHILYHLGYVQSQLGRRDTAIATFTRAIELDPQEAPNYTSLGSIYLKQRQYELAIEAYRTAVRLEPNSGMAHANLGIALQRAGTVEEARAELKRAIELSSTNADAFSALGIIDFGEGRHGDAAENFKRAIAIDDQIPEYHTNLGQAYSWLGNVDEALAAFDAALQINPDFPQALYNLGNLNLNIGRQEAGEQVLWRCIEANPRYLNTYDRLGASIWGQWAKVAEVYQRGVDENPGYADFHEYLGNARLYLRECEAAIAACRSLRALDDRRAGSYWLEGAALVELTRESEGLEFLREGRKRATPEEVAEIEQWIEKAESRLAQSLALERLIAGEDTTDDRTQLLAAVELAHARGRNVACVALYQRARATTARVTSGVASEPPLDHRGPEHALAIRAALLASCRDGQDATGLSAEQVSRHRALAMAWSREALEAWVAAAAADAGTIPQAHLALSGLRDAPETVPVRGEDELAALELVEREAWQRLWGDVDKALAEWKR